MEAHRRDTLQSLKLRPGFYRKMYRTVLRVVVVNSFVLAGLCALTVYLGFYGFKPEHYFTTSPSSKILELRAGVAKPYVKPATESQNAAPPTNAQPAQ